MKTVESKIVIVGNDLERTIYYIPESLDIVITKSDTSSYSSVKIEHLGIVRKTTIKLNTLKKGNNKLLTADYLCKKSSITVVYDKTESIDIFDYEEGKKEVQKLLIKYTQNLYAEALLYMK